MLNAHLVDLSDKRLLNAKSIFITGATAGIGAQMATSFAEYGAKNLILLGRNVDKLAQIKQNLLGVYNNLEKVITYSLDFNQPSLDIDALLEKFAEENINCIDVALNNAGILGEIETLKNYDINLWQQVMQVNVNSTLAITQKILPFLEKSKSASLIFTTSSVGSKPRAMWGAYSVSKSATEAMMQIFNQELSATNIRVNAINPGGTSTSMRASAYPDENPSSLPTALDLLPTYLYLASDKSFEENGKIFNAQAKN